MPTGISNLNHNALHFDKFQLMRIKLREYKTTDYEQLEQLFYNTVHSVNAKDYTEE